MQVAQHGKTAAKPPKSTPHLHRDDLSRIEAIVGHNGVSKFVRDVIRQALDQIAPGEEKAGPPYLEINGDHEPRLSVSGRATIFAILRKRKASLDELQRAFGFEDPIDFIHALLGHRPLPNQAAGVIVAELLGKLWQGE